MGMNIDTFAPSFHRAIVLADVVGFGAAHRTDADRLALRRRFYDVLSIAFTSAGVPWENCEREDRGDGALILVAPELSPEAMAGLLVESLPQAIVAALDWHNHSEPPAGPLQLRLALHAGEVNAEEEGYAGSSIIHAARLLDSAPLRQAQAASSIPVALIVSETLYQHMIRNASLREPAAYQRVEVAVKEIRTVAWVRQFPHPSQIDRMEPLANQATGPSAGASARRGTRDFDSFYLANYRFVRNVVNARAQDWALAVSVTDEAMTIAYRRWHDVAEHPEPIGFVILTARRILSRVQRQRARKAPPVAPIPLDGTPGLEPVAHGADPAEAAVVQTALQQALRMIPADQRECFVLYQIFDQPIRLIAEQLNLPEGTVKTRLRAARRALRDLLKDDLGEGGIR